MAGAFHAGSVLCVEICTGAYLWRFGFKAYCEADKDQQYLTLDYFSWPSPSCTENVLVGEFCIYWAFKSMEELYLDVYFDFLREF